MRSCMLAFVSDRCCYGAILVKIGAEFFVVTAQNLGYPLIGEGFLAFHSVRRIFV